MASNLLFTVWILFLPCITNFEETSEFSDIKWDRINIPGWNSAGMNEIGKLLFEGEVSPGYELIRQELVSSFLISLKICQNGFDEAAQRVDSLLDFYDPSEMIDKEEDYIDLSETDLHLLEVLEENKAEILDDLSDMLETGDDDDVPTRPTYVKDLKRILRTFNYACMSFPLNLPNLHNRGKRSPQKIAQKLAISLTKWTKRWLNSIEGKISIFMTNCLNDDDCQSYLEDVIKTLVKIMKENENNFGKDSSGILEELLRDLSYKSSPSMESLSSLQRSVLEMGSFVDGLKGEEENAFLMAEGINDFGGEDLGKKLVIFSSLFKGNSAITSSAQNAAELEIETDYLVTKIPDTFLSVAFGSSLIKEDWGKIKNKLPKFLNIASALSPSILRVGGSAANFLTYDPNIAKNKTKGYHLVENDELSNYIYHNIHPKLRKRKQEDPQTNYIAQNLIPTSLNHPKSKSKTRFLLNKNRIHKMYISDEVFDVQDECEPQLNYKKDYKNFTMTGNDWKFLVDLTHDLNWTLLFDLNQFWRDLHGDWDPTNAKLLFEDSLSSKIPIIWQLGNEPNAYLHKFDWSISPEQAAKDYRILRHELNQNNPSDNVSNVTIVGPDVTRPKHETEDSMEFLERFLQAGNEEINVVSWHQYYMDGRTATLDEFLSLETLNIFPKQLQKMVSIRDELASGKPIWLTETASAWGGGAPGLSNRFAGGIPWLDKLGAAALGGASLVFRQTLYGGCYALLDLGLNPYPDFWVSVLHKQLVGEGVLLPRTRLAPDSLRMYAHCLNSKHPMFKKGAIVIFGINLSEYGERIHLHGNNFKKFPKFLYQLSPPQGDLKSRDIWFNGEVLKISKEGHLPPLTPIADMREELEFPPWSMLFWVFPGAKAAAC